MKSIIIFITVCILGSIISATNLNASIKKANIVSIFPNELCKDKGIAINKDDRCINMKDVLFSIKREKLNDLLTKPIKIIEEVPASNKVLLPKEMTDKQEGSRVMLYDYHSLLTLGIVEPMSDEQCTISGLFLDPKRDVVVEIKGRRLPFKKEAIPIFLENPGKYFATKQAKGAFISEEMTNSAPINPIYLIIGVYLILGLVIGGITGSIALKKDLKAFNWFALGFLFNFIALVLLLIQSKEKEAMPIGMLGRIKKTREPIICLNCSYQNHPNANNCSKCNAVFVR